MIKAIKAGLLIDGTGQTPEENMLIIIEDNIIKSIKKYNDKDIPEKATFLTLKTKHYYLD